MMHIVQRCLVVAGCLLLLCGLAFAGNPLARPTSREAREHLDRGNRLYHMRSFEEAIVEYKAGALVEPATVFDYNLAQSYRQLGKYTEAIWHYERFLNYGRPEGELLDAVNAFLKEMRAQLANRAQTMPPNDPAPPGNDGSTASSTVRVSPHSEPGRLEVSTTSTSPPGTDWLGWGLAGAGVAAMGTAGAVLLSASHLNDQANMEPDVRRWNQLHDQAGTRRTIGVVIGIGGMGLTVAGAVRLMLHTREMSRPSAARLDVGITSNGMFVAGKF
jgi:tetratricopeptide (TPR) repeat protein